MESLGGVEVDVVDTRRTRWRSALIGVGVAIAGGLLMALAPQAAHADDGGSGGSGLLGSLLHDVTSTVTTVVEPVVAPLPDVRELPIVGGLVGQVADSKPVGSVTQPVADLVDDLLGDTVGSLPIVGGLLGDRPVGSITGPVGGLADDALGQVTGAPAAPTDPDSAVPTDPDSSAVPPLVDPAFGVIDVGAVMAVVAVDTALISSVDDVVVAAGAEGSLHGPVSVPGDISPTSAVTAGGPPIGLAAAVLGVGLLFLLARGRIGATGFRAPPSPVFATDTSPD